MSRVTVSPYTTMVLLFLICIPAHQFVSMSWRLKKIALSYWTLNVCPWKSPIVVLVVRPFLPVTDLSSGLSDRDAFQTTLS